MENNKKKKKKSKKKIAIIILVIIIVLWIVIGNQNKAKKAELDNKISTENIEKRTIVKTISASGTIKSTNSKEYTTTLVGKTIKKVNVKVGDRVNVGDSLVTFDIKDLNDSLKVAQDGLNIAREQTNLGISAAEKGVNSATDARNSQGNSLDNQVNSLSGSIGQIDTQIAEIQKTLATLSQAEAAKKVELDNTNAVNKPIIDNYNNKNTEYGNSVKELENYKNQFIAERNNYNKYFPVGDLTIQLDPVTGVQIQQSEYKDGIYATAEHRNVDTNYNNLKNNYTSNVLNLESKVNSGKALVDSLQAGYNTAKVTVDKVQSEYNTVLKQKQEAEKMLKELTSNKSQLNAQYEQAKSTADSTKKSLDSAVDQARTSLENSRLTAKSTILTQESQLKTVREQVEKGTLKSDVAGTVTNINVKEGDLYQGGTILKIECCETFMIEAQIDEYDIADVKVGMKVKIKTDATREEELEGKVTFVAPTATENMVGNGMSLTGATTSSGATYKIEISVDSVNDRLRIGMNAKLSIITEEAANTLTIPYDAIETKEDGKNVIKILEEDGTTQTEIEVTKGLESDYYTEIKSDKVKEGMKVIVPDTGSGDAMNTLINSMQASTGI